jgi:hypothetical protein
MTEESQGIFVKMSAQEAQVLSNGHLGEELDGMKANNDVPRTSMERADGVEEVHYFSTWWENCQVSSEQTG